jgi:hypothetical protein
VVRMVKRFLFGVDAKPSKPEVGAAPHLMTQSGNPRAIFNGVQLRCVLHLSSVFREQVLSSR